MADKRHVVVVCGYGCHLDTPLRPYLDRVFRFIQDEHPNAVIFCGGFTQKKTAPGVSEAGLMRKYIKADQFSELMFRVFEEYDSYTTYANIQNAAWRIGNWLICRGIFGDEKIRITIFCEATRAANVIMLARHFMGSFVESIDDITVETASWERADPFRQVGNLIHNKLAITCPWLGLAEREHNRRVKRAEHI